MFYRKESKMKYRALGMSKNISPEEFMQTDEYKRRAYSYQYKRSVDDLRNDPLTYEGKKYISTVKLQKQIEDDFVAIITPIRNDLWKMDGSPTIMRVAPTSIDGVINKVWVNIGDKVEIVIWEKDKEDMRNKEQAFVTAVFNKLWDDRAKS